MFLNTRTIVDIFVISADDGLSLVFDVIFEFIVETTFAG